MTTFTHKSIALDIGLSLIRTYVFNLKGDYVVRDFDLKEEMTPGSLTVFICELVDSMDIDHLVEKLTVVIPGVVDTQRRLVQSFAELPGWRNVPLADWLEIRLGKKVSIFSKKSHSLITDLTLFSS